MGVWKKDNTAGLTLGFAVACGPTYTAPSANVWLNAFYIAAPGQVNGVTNNADVFRITGVVVLPGTHAITAAQAPLLMRPYGEELALCKRYFAKGMIRFGATGTGPKNCMVVWQHPVAMRAIPTRSFTDLAGTPNVVTADGSNGAALSSSGIGGDINETFTDFVTAGAVSFWWGCVVTADARL